MDSSERETMTAVDVAPARKSEPLQWAALVALILETIIVVGGIVVAAIMR
jgi:hypothetical protein